MTPPARLLVALALVAGCRAADAPCGAAAPCEAGGACVVGVCRPGNGEVIRRPTRRVVLDAVAFAALEPGAGEGTPEVVPLGAASRPALTLLLAFDADLASDVEVEGAFLVLHPARESAGPQTPVDLEVSPVLSPWSPGTASYGRAPRLGAPLAAVTAPPEARAPVRVDVTKLFAERRASNGLAVRATTVDAVGARLAVGSGSTPGPRLELYLR